MPSFSENLFSSERSGIILTFPSRPPTLYSITLETIRQSQVVPLFGYPATNIFLSSEFF